MESGFSRYDLHERVIEQMPQIGYVKPTPVQHRVIPLLIQGKNLIVEAATGTGKTAAYGLPLISKLNHLKRSPQLLVLVPSRELAIQVEAALKSFSTFPQLKIEALYGGSRLEHCTKKLKSAPQIVIAVPGRLRDILHSDPFPHFWKDIKYLVIDEADKLLEAGFFHETQLILSKMKGKIQVSLFSATIPEGVEELIRENFRPIMTVRMPPAEAVRNIRFHNVKFSGNKEKSLVAMIDKFHVPRALIFCNKREEVYSITNYLRNSGKKADSYHGLLDQQERGSILERFKKSLSNFLVATDLGARGLDVPYLPAVVNYSLPQELDIYLHRVGRTGRAGLGGEAYNLCGKKADMEILKKFHSPAKIKAVDHIISLKGIKKIDEEKIEKWMKIHLNRGKKDKIRKGDVLGFFIQGLGFSQDDIGNITIYDQHSILDIPEKMFEQIKDQEGNEKIKGKTLKIRKFGLDEQKKRAKGVKRLVISSRKRGILKTKGDEPPKK